MANWHIVDNDVIINSIVADSKEFAESLFPDYLVVEDDGVIGIGWTKESGEWKAAYPTDGKVYFWSEEVRRWELENSPPEESIV